MIHFTLVVIVINPQGAAAPVVQEQPIVQEEQPMAIDLDPLRWHCPNCSWWNTYDNPKGLKIGSFQHLKRCKGVKKPLFGG